jgi:mannitol/fructose-specific phosphotransferase system IIA component (Ntr-type)/nucleotide-binding universal stress UspA family protein
VVAVASRPSEGAILTYADMLTSHRNARVTPVRLHADNPFVVPWGSPANGSGNGFIRGAITHIARVEKVGLIVSEWLSDPLEMQDVLRLAHELAVPAVFVRHSATKPRGRVLVATAGGPNVLQQMWVARQTACTLGLPVHFLRIVHPAVTPAAMPPTDAPTDALDACSCRLLHMEARMETKRAVNVADAIASSVRQDDLLVIGGPSALRLTADFAGSLPHAVAGRVSAPMVLLSAPPENRISLRRLFWGGLIKTGLRPHDKRHAVSALIENLAHHNQLPRSSVADTLDRALRREAIMSTAVDCETAFPHVTLRGFFGVVGSMAVCPDGVAFDSPDGRPTRFLYLLVTPDGLCDEYLSTLAMIARRMIRQDVRAALLRCQTPAQVLDILEPREMPTADPESVTRAGCPDDDFSTQPLILDKRP